MLSAKNSETTETWPSETCNGEAVYCHASSCEDFNSFSCAPCLFSIGCSEYVKINGMSYAYDGLYSPTKYLESNRVVFLKDDGHCIWWNYQYRNWWVGQCENVGSNSGFAYLEEDSTCPFNDNIFSSIQITQTWRRGESDELIDGVEVLERRNYYASAYVAAVEQTASAAVNAISRNGQYQQKCRFVYNNGNYRCRKSWVNRIFEIINFCLIIEFLIWVKNGWGYKVYLNHRILHRVYSFLALGISENYFQVEK